MSTCALLDTCFKSNIFDIFILFLSIIIVMKSAMNSLNFEEYLKRNFMFEEFKISGRSSFLKLLLNIFKMHLERQSVSFLSSQSAKGAQIYSLTQCDLNMKECDCCILPNNDDLYCII